MKNEIIMREKDYLKQQYTISRDYEFSSIIIIPEWVIRVIKKNKIKT